MYAAKVKYNRFYSKFKGINLCFYDKKTNLIILANLDFKKKIISTRLHSDLISYFK